MELKCWKVLLLMVFGMLLIVLNGIEMRIDNNKARQLALLIVLNGIEIRRISFRL